MFHCKERTWHWAVTIFIAIFLTPSLIVPQSVRTEQQSVRRGISAFKHDQDGDEKKKGLTRQQREREAWAWHEANRQRLERTHPLGKQALTSDITVNDTNDISVIQGDGRLITNPNAFDLNGLSVQFTPSGGGYTISTAAGTFDTNLGTKLDLTVPPAINPLSVPEPGDDAFIVQNLPFNFTYFGSTFSSVAVASNGNLTFRPGNVGAAAFAASTVDSTPSLNVFQSEVPRIAPYWHDLDARASQTTGSTGIFIRNDADRVLVTWNNIRDYPNAPTDTGVHRFQVSLFNDGRIVFTYATAQLTSQSLVGISPGLTNNAPTLIDLTAPPSGSISNPIAEFFSTTTAVDYLGAVQAFYAAHPNNDVYDFIYFMTDFDFDLGDAFAFYQPLRNDATGIGQTVFTVDPTGILGSQKLQGILNLSNLIGAYPDLPTTRFIGANHALSVMGQEQGHRWLAYIGYPGADPLLLLGRDNAHWSFFYSIESTISSPGVRRSSSEEGNVWQDNGNGTFTTVNLIDGYSRLDQYLMGLRPASDVPDTFVIANPSNTIRTRGSNPRPNSTVTGTRQNITISQILQANGSRVPDSTTSQKSFRTAVILLVRQGAQTPDSTINKVTRYRLAWESYFAQSTDYLAGINTGLAALTTPRTIAAASAASYQTTLAPGEITGLYGAGLTDGSTVEAQGSTLPTTLAGTQVLIDGVPAGLFYASPTQINFEIPRTTTAITTSLAVNSATALIEVVNNGQLIRVGSFQIAPAVPAVFTLNQSGAGEAAAVDAFTGALGPFNAVQTNGQPNIISVFGTGLGADATDVGGNVNASVQVTIDGNPVTVNYAGQSPPFFGLNQLNIVFPAGISSGAHTLVVSRNGIPSQSVTVTVK